MNVKFEAFPPLSLSPLPPPPVNGSWARDRMKGGGEGGRGAVKTKRSAVCTETRTFCERHDVVARVCTHAGAALVPITAK